MLPAQILGIIGAGLLLFGTFIPVVSAPILGGQNLAQLDGWLALFLIVVSVAHIFFCIRKLWWGLWITKIALALSLTFAVVHNWGIITGRVPLIARVVEPFIKIQWGVGLLTAGILVLLASPMLPRPQPPQGHASPFV
jgi:hypothetical protein